jgi:hypothetical protein
MLFKARLTSSGHPGLLLAAGLGFLTALGGATAIAEGPPSVPAASGSEANAAEAAPLSLEQLARRLERLEDQNAKLAEQNAKLSEQNAKLATQNRSLEEQVTKVSGQYDELNRRFANLSPGPTVPAASLPAPLPPTPTAQPPSAVAPPSATTIGVADQPEGALNAAEPSQSAASRFLVGEYDDERGAFVLVRPRDAQRVPFELRLDLFTQARYSNFARSAKTWIDSTGAPRLISNSSSVEITRNFVQFSGFAIDPRLQYTTILFSSTALNDTVYLGWINYQFNDAFDLRVGNWIVPGTREWLESFRYTMGADRLMATTFFRPNISPGIWAQGEPIKGVNYVAMFANSLNRFSQGVERIGSAPTFGGTVWWDPRGDFGPGPSDAENHQRLTPRIGTNLALSHEKNQGYGSLDQGNPEDTILRLSDGTPLFRPGALVPGIELSAASVQVWTIDAALKYRGFGLSGEYFLRWLDDFRFAGGALPIHSLFDQGGLLQGGYFVIPGKLEGYARTSFVTGRFGTGNEVGGGVNWYVRGTRDWRMTFEVLQINHSPAQNILTGYRAGESGTLFQLQWFTDF